MGFGINFYECGTVLEMFNAFITDVLTVDVYLLDHLNYLILRKVLRFQRGNQKP